MTHQQALALYDAVFGTEFTGRGYKRRNPNVHVAFAAAGFPVPNDDLQTWYPDAVVGVKARRAAARIIRAWADALDAIPGEEVVK